MQNVERFCMSEEYRYFLVLRSTRYQRKTKQCGLFLLPSATFSFQATAGRQRAPLSAWDDQLRVRNKNIVPHISFELPQDLYVWWWRHNERSSGPAHEQMDPTTILRASTFDNTSKIRADGSSQWSPKHANYSLSLFSSFLDLKVQGAHGKSTCCFAEHKPVWLWPTPEKKEWDDLAGERQNSIAESCNKVWNQFVQANKSIKVPLSKHSRNNSEQRNVIQYSQSVKNGQNRKKGKINNKFPFLGSLARSKEKYLKEKL